MGFGDALPLLDALLLRSADAYIVVMCGNNEKLRKTLSERYGASGRVKPISYTNQVSLYLDAADVLLSKPGGLSSTEAAVKEIPLVHMNPLPGWEEENVRFFAALGMSLSGKTAEEMADAAASLLSDRAAAQQMMRRQGEEINKRAADDVLDAMSL
jgi:processive 1,2-diacylglycerol beta-glucosyltransferase